MFISVSTAKHTSYRNSCGSNLNELLENIKIIGGTKMSTLLSVIIRMKICILMR